VFLGEANHVSFANKTLALKETMNNTKHLKKNENYNKIFEKPFIFNLQTMSTVRRRCRSSLGRPNIVGCGREVAERIKKTTSVPKTLLVAYVGRRLAPYTTYMHVIELGIAFIPMWCNHFVCRCLRRGFRWLRELMYACWEFENIF
jgi:hypothetical protein